MKRLGFAKYTHSVSVLCFVFVTGCATSGGPNSPGTTAPSRGRGSPWTILCVELRGGFARENAENIADTLRRTPDINPREVRTSHDADGASRVYYGTYHRKTEANTGKRNIPPELQRDLVLIRELGVGSGERYFVGARIVRFPVPDVGNPAWQLRNASGVYSLQVAAFEPTDDFWDYKAAAAKYCEWLRSKGYEAYYFHGETVSIVTVGSFGESAVIPSERGLPRYSAEVVAMQRDELLRYNLVNGAIVKARSVDPVVPGQTGKPQSAASGSLQPVPSRLVPIPRERNARGPS